MTAVIPHTPQVSLDRYHVHNVRGAYLKLNQARLELAREGLTESQRIFLDMLPLLLHFNHPMLPGYFSRSTPSGLDGFETSEEQIYKLRMLTRSFQPNRDNKRRADILALFSMGSFGTIAQNSKSDMDVWVCYHPDLSRDSLLSLEKKCKTISVWAKRQQLDVTFFLMNHQTFRSEKSLSFGKEASGSTQHYLLLDEFYRTAIHLGGQLPSWLFIRPEQESSYDECREVFCEQRPLPEKRFIDFGPIQKVPADEFVTSAIWQLYKAIDSPYKSIIKLLLLEIYCQNPSKPRLLSRVFKEQLHAVDQHRIVHLWDVDPYLQTYYFIEDYLLSTNQRKRLEFFRRCFYFKLEQPLTGGHKISSRSSIVFEMTKAWGWDSDYIHHLDEHTYWNLKEVLEERRLIINELNHSYHYIMDFFRSQKIRMQASNRELNVLGRKLHAAFSRKAGKIEWVNPLSSKNIAEPTLVIKKQKETNIWFAVDKNNNTIIKKTTPVELITWLHCNQVMISASRLYFDRQNLDSRLLQSLRRLITSLLPLPIKTASHEVFEKGCHLDKLLMFIDYRPDKGYQELKDLDREKIATMECNIDLLSVNSWNEIICDSKQGPFLETILHVFIEAIQSEQVIFKPDILCNHPDRVFQQQLREKLNVLFKNISRFFQENPSGRYISYIDGRYLAIHINEKQSEIRWLSTERELKQNLMSPMPYYSPVGMDENTMSHHPLMVYTQHNRPESVQVFFRSRGEEADITLIDEIGTWHECTIDYRKKWQSLQPFHRFLRVINDRRHDQPATEVGPLDIFPIAFYEVIHTDKGWQTERCPISSQMDNYSGVKLYAVAEYINKKYQFTLYMDDVIFSEANEGLDAYQRLAAFIISKKTYTSENSFYITDIDLSRCRFNLSATGELYTSHYLHMKKLLENKINSVLRAN